MAGVQGLARRDTPPARPRWRRPVRRAAALLAGVTLLLVRPDAAGAHAELDGSEPASGAHLDASPSQVVLSFTEAVELPDDAVEVLAASGDPVDVAAPVHPDGDRSIVEVDLPALDDGAYVVSWRIISEDSHPIGGAFTFAVGDASVADARAMAGDVSAASGASPSLGIVFGIDRFVAFAGMALLVGGAGFLLTLWPAGLDDRRARRLVAGGWVAVFLATAAGIALQAAYVQGGTLADAVDPGLVGDELSARVGRIWLVRLVLLVAVAIAARLVTRPLSRARAGAAVPGGDDGSGTPPTPPVPPRVPDELTFVAALVGLALLVTVSYAGHASSGRWVPVAMVADVVHLAGVSAWLGGLALLCFCVLRPAPVTAEGPRSIAAIDTVVARFSPVAFVAVVAIVASGVVQAWRQLGSVSALWDTTYGRLLIVKVLLVVVMLAAAAASRAWVRGHLRPGLVAPAPSAGAGDADSGATGGTGGGDADAPPVLSPGPGAAAAGSTRDLSGIRRSVAIEVVVAVLVLGVTAGLVESVPGRVGGAEAGPAADGGPYTTEQHGNEVLVELSVARTAVGPADITIEARNHDGTPASPEEVTGQLRLPERDLGPIDLTLEDRGGGTYTSSGADLPFPGTWELLVTVRTSDIDQDRFSTTFVVR